ncbi:MAG: single-stranded-DNA-specific exonuclease RecJ [Cocleimonas sp.]|nr:single-stranded-DNA-specific exonuclease RecJ [Cocleimonas sp.]
MMTLVARERKGKIEAQDVASPLLHRIFAGRDIDSKDDLSCELKDLHPISQLKGIHKAVEVLIDAIESAASIVIIGDFDADGATATTVAVRSLTMMGVKNIHYLVPNRFEFGYGLTPEIVDQAQQFKPDLIITVDNGISSIDGVARAKALNCRVIITDHHLPGRSLPDADAIINPNQPDCDFPSKNLAGVGVIFYLMLALKSKLQQQDYFQQQQIPVPNLTSLLDIVALGTVADVVPLDKNNRILVEQGLKRMRSKQCCAGIQALFSVAGRNIHNAVSSDLGFSCGPRLNAAGRLDDMSIGIETLLASDYQQAMEMAAALDDLNRERREIESSMKSEALQILEKEFSTLDSEDQLPVIFCLYKEDWHQGVIGILAARIRERYHRPAIIFAPGDKGIIKGSARSITGLHIRDILDVVATQNTNLVDKFGGHAMAAGLSMAEENLPQFIDAINHVIKEQVDASVFEEKLFSDGALQRDEFNLNSADQIRFAAPWGQLFPAPVFDNQFQIIQKRILKNAHIKLTLRLIENESPTATTVDAIAFNVNLEEWPEQGALVHLLYKLDVNEFRGVSSPQLMIDRLL